MPPLPPFPKSYSAEMVRSNGDRAMLYVDGWTRRMEMYPKVGRPSIIISRADKRVIWSLCPDTKTYSQAKLPEGMERAFHPDMLYDWSEDGTEMIDGRRCKRFVGRLREPRGPIGDAHNVRFVDAKTGIHRRDEGYGVDGKLVVTTDYLHAKVGVPPRKLFEMPEGYKRAYHRRQLVVG